MTVITRTARITGRVQGVAYRAWVRGQAEKKGLQGWVRNCDDGSVMALFHGPEPDVDAMITACWSGPGAASVRNVDCASAAPPTEAGFHILR
ncbi:acylphosphatase [Pseudooceanicola sediminis]|uniref:acylphosphatase n=1 Tax=Pseudooceanicola sediminis TaxID=2211117 RepID=A0A399J228_9RHOB|nr:acylphosphatase [Pseudooceanicola sediminis]KAA2314649.1 acylphosphatase [Puniceibacterium sp. HSS470]RII39395.1 acylphosphatase [Pseudooceanicola sediminis]|tara:strand:+ start:5265 stop:5540 length:276 start_codon:yes stop_codon:yes gene_type:complete